MSDGPTGDPWSDYVRGIKRRTRLTVAELARRTKIHRATLFNYMKPGSGESVTTRNVVALAHVAGDDPIIAFRAAAGLDGVAPEDVELSMVLEVDDISDEDRDRILASIVGRRERDRERRIEDTQEMIRIAGGRVA
jgi:hypothetical protein